MPIAEGRTTMEVEDEFSFRHAEFGVLLFYLDRSAWKAVGYLGLTFVEGVWDPDC